ncbi:Uncharacterized conserved protein, DUF885 familyt [Nocardioides scoriae]|uniref:Uncharacterized conserved protein, DUF885 familyt n=1 Tax=Nocardioides scoriae TaxID=642780 RepID=A0A1H1SCP6_9ACTN|nr:DUF885 domain-containing protein [Nocardioides scoriae]SDS45754.1 Uncharacterized conserved protein, DUF885 familyt [Nocardioides scoriae]
MSDSITSLAEDYWQHHLSTHPTEAHLVGRTEWAGEFEGATRADEDAQVEALRGFAARAEALDPAGLDPQEVLTREVLLAHTRASADVLETRLGEMAADPIFGLQVSMGIIAPMLALPTPEVAEALVGKYAAIGRHLHELAERQREGIASGRLPAAFAVADTVAQLDARLAGPVADDPLLLTSTPPSGIDVDGWKARLREVVETEVRPGLAAYRAVLRNEVLPLARPDEQVGLTHLPGGDEAYAALLRYFTTTDKSAQEIHDIGLAQVAQLAEEYRALGPEVVGTADLAAIFEAMRTDPALHFEHGEQLVEASEVAMQRAWDAMPQWFETLPQARCVVQATTSGAKAFYFPPSADGSRGGTFFINVDDPSAWGTFELEAMAFHEGIPGHHLQLAIAGELTTVPEFRKHLHNAAYAEGWGLYTERLADEMGLYSGPVDRMGMYAADSMRACRLVVDTGMHALGWSREQAVQYMVDNSPLAEGVVRPEIDRYAVTPGQACSYMIGRLEIQRMRREAEERQGSDFSLPAFHSAVLDSGSLPLGVLDDVVVARLG